MLDRSALEERIAVRIAKATEALQHSFGLATPLINASRTLSDTLLNDGKILVLGTGSSAALAQIFVAHMIHQFERDRPALPAIALSSDVVTISSLADQPNTDQYARQIKALGKANDALLVISATGTRANVIRSVIAAHDASLPVIALTGGDGGELAPLLNFHDIEVRVHSDHPTTVREQHLMIIHCLNELIDHQIFG